MAQAQVAAAPKFLDRIQLYLNKKSVASIYGPCVFIVLTVAYFYTTAVLSRHSEFWFDDVVAVQTAQQPNSRAIIDAVMAGLEMSPPTLYLALHQLLPLTHFWPIQVVARIPPTLAAFGAAVVIFVLLRRRVDTVISLFAFGIMLTMGLFPFALQVREYAFMVFFLSLVLLFWDNMEGSKHAAINGFGIWITLALCLALHVYGIIDVITIGVCEALWIITRRQLRVAVLAPLVCLIPVGLAMAPVYLRLATFNAADVYSPNFYAKPTSEHLFHSIDVVLLGGPLGLTLILLGALLVGVLYYGRRLTGQPQSLGVPAAQGSPGELSRLEIMMIALALIPIVTFLIATFVTKAYSERYITGVTLLAPMAAASVLGRLRDGRIVAVLLSPLLLFDLVHKTRFQPGAYGGILPTLEQYTRDTTLPIVVDDGVFFNQILYAADPAMRSRMALLTASDQAPPRDPTNQNFMLRAVKFVDYVHVAKLEDFLQSHPSFYLLTEMQTRAITVVPPLMEACALGPLVAQINGKFLFKAGLDYAKQNCGKP
jgi:hypothetical protein